MSDEERVRAQRAIDAEEAKQAAERQKKIDEARQLISSMEISCSADMPKPIAPGSVMKSTIEIETNLFGIRLTEDYAIYKYDIDIICDTGKKVIEFSKKGRSDYVATDRMKQCLIVFNKAIRETGTYRDDLIFFYDGQSIMYCTEKLEFSDGHKHCTVILEGAHISEDLKFFKFINFVIKECNDRFQSHLSDIRKIDRNIVAKDRSAMQFVDVATSMYAMSQCETRFTIFANGKIFPSRPDLEGIQTVPMKEGKVLIPGMTKSIKLVEGPRGRSNASPALAVDSLRVVFHVNGNLADKAKSCFPDFFKPTIPEINAFAAMVRGLGCTTNHMKNRKRRVEIFAISRDNALSYKLEIKFADEQEARTVSVAEYFKKRYELDLKYPQAPLIVAIERGQHNLYPMEVLEVIPMQRVTIPQTTPIQSQVATKECAVPPGARQNAIVTQCNLHDMFNPEQVFLKAAGLEIVSNPLRASGRILKAPILKYKSSEMEVVQAAWRPPQNYQFIVPASCDRWLMFGVLGPRDTFGLPEMHKFAEAFVKTCRMRGMQINLPNEVAILPSNPQDKTPDMHVRAAIEKAAFDRFQFIFFITNDLITIHKHVKLQESYSRIVTQDLKLRTAMNFLQKNQTLTMDNIVAKTNCKLGGLNYSVNLKNVVGPNIDPLSASRLIVGIGLAPAPACATYVSSTGVKLPSPTVVGYSANMGNTPTEYFGDFIYQDSKKDDQLLCTTEMLKNIIDRFTGLINADGTRATIKQGEPTPRPLPKELIVYRQGLTEGSYAMCLKDEIPLMKAILARYGANECKVTYIAVQREHNIRMMPVMINTMDKATQQNIGSGVVIDTQLTHPRYREFYLNSHITLQGTARTPRYTVLHDDSNLSMNGLESLTQALAFNFQIVNSPVSVPAPLYIANRYAQRGVDLFTAKATDEMASSEQRERTSLAEMNEDLGYAHKNLGAARINA